MKKRIFSLLTALLLVFSIVPMAASEAHLPNLLAAGGSFVYADSEIQDGTAAHPYRISNDTELIRFAGWVNAGSKDLCGVLTADINLSGVDWTPIGGANGDYSKASGYAGTFNGNGKTIRGLNINMPDVGSAPNRGIGLFGITNNAIIKNLNVAGNVSAASYAVGGIVGLSYGNTKIINCQFSGSVTNSKSAFSAGTGGIVGSIGTNGDGLKVMRCANFAAVSSTASNGNVGGVLGYSGGKSFEITDCYNAGDIAGGNSSATKIGGIAGNGNGNTDFNKAKIVNAYNIGSITNATGSGNPSRGRIAGSAVSVQIVNCHSIDIEKEKVSVGDGGSAPSVTAIADSVAGKAALLSALNSSETEHFTYDTAASPINSGFPILKWQAGEPYDESGAETQAPSSVVATTVKAIANFYDGMTKTQIVPYGEYVASSGLAKEYGFTSLAIDAHVRDNEVTMFDMLVAILAEKYGSTGPDDRNAALVKSNIGFNQGTVRTLFDYDAFTQKPFSMIQNGIMPNDGVYNDTYHSYNGLTIDDSVIENGDLLNYFFYQASDYSDNFGYFTQNGRKITSVTVPAGESITVGLRGYSLRNGMNTPEVIAASTSALSGVTLAVSNADGTLTAISGAVTDASGNASITFADNGTYIVTGVGNANTPLVTPYLSVKVTGKANPTNPQDSGTSSGGSTDSGSTGGAGGAGGGGAETAPLANNAPAKEAKVSMSGDAMKEMTAKSGHATISTEAGNITFDKNAIEGLASGKNDIEITLSSGKNVESASLSKEAKQALKEKGDIKQIVSLDINAGGKSVDKLTGKAVVNMPLAVSASEDANAIIISKIDEKGNMTVVADGYFDSETGAMKFSAEGSGKYVISSVKVSFEDTKNHWSKDYVTFLAARNIVQGKGDGNFGSNDKVKKCELVAMLARASGDVIEKADGTAFSDVSQNAWYADVLAWAKKVGIIMGDDKNNANAESEISRQDMSVMIDRFAKYKEKELAKKNGAVTFTDSGKIAPYAKSSVEMMQKAGIISGRPTDDGFSFDPQAGASRGELSKMMCLVIKN